MMNLSNSVDPLLTDPMTPLDWSNMIPMTSSLQHSNSMVDMRMENDPLFTPTISPSLDTTIAPTALNSFISIGSPVLQANKKPPQVHQSIPHQQLTSSSFDLKWINETPDDVQKIRRSLSNHEIKFKTPLSPESFQLKPQKMETPSGLSITTATSVGKPYTKKPLSERRNSASNPSMRPVTPAMMLNMAKVGAQKSPITPTTNNFHDKSYASPNFGDKAMMAMSLQSPVLTPTPETMVFHQAQMQMPMYGNTYSPAMQPTIFPSPSIHPNQNMVLQEDINEMVRQQANFGNYYYDYNTEVMCVGVEQRRSHHKAAEQKRRDCIKQCFQELRKMLPMDKDKQPSRMEILQKAYEYIIELQIENEQLKEKLVAHEMTNANTNSTSNNNNNSN
ncbi:HLH-domain-containing protein [Rozella allomycis CSF55]|uniref:HLH-domain-containing protein n=1 Tax=Rozella allomycis (strain CSF55) TaxID=988480 RepID=A0A075B3X3_ROZAC|nr:hypothetical protein O9G_003565 [Rozella allomycis CSF55]RKP21049.1 HLH-domain-containing protein [Rozella allomycis CSF55]|eukprot:EPZ35847.1 hypothetical protein O9G_003565 [Rozella allomycis CSF55]